MTTKNLEKEFRIEVVASLLENTLINNSVTESEIYEICSFVSGEVVNETNFYYKGSTIRLIMLELQPELNSVNIKISNNTNDSLEERDTLNILSLYRRQFGDVYSIKSIKKGVVKSLKI